MFLKTESSPEWLEHVFKNFDSFLIDHAACERKASATAMSLVAHYPDKTKLVAAMIDLSLEELTHFKQVYEILQKRHLVLRVDEKDLYVNELLKLIRKGPSEYFLDRLLIAGVIEARGCERFASIAKHLPEGEMKNFYQEITRSEAKHQHLFINLAKHYFPTEVVQTRLEELTLAEANILSQLPLRAAVH